jgi:hypothetical protein
MESFVLSVVVAGICIEGLFEVPKQGTESPERVHFLVSANVVMRTLCDWKSCLYIALRACMVRNNLERQGGEICT